MEQAGARRRVGVARHDLEAHLVLGPPDPRRRRGRHWYHSCSEDCTRIAQTCWWQEKIQVPFDSVGKMLVVLGLVIVVIGAGIMLFGRLPFLGNLPGPLSF